MRLLAALTALATLAAAQVNFTSPDLSKPVDLSNTTLHVQWHIDPANTTLTNTSLTLQVFLKGPDNQSYKAFEFAQAGNGDFGFDWQTKDLRDAVAKANKTLGSGKDYVFELSFLDLPANAVKATVDSAKFAFQSAAPRLGFGMGAAVVVAVGTVMVML